jgi:hypothetical protein
MSRQCGAFTIHHHQNTDERSAGLAAQTPRPSDVSQLESNPLCFLKPLPTVADWPSPRILSSPKKSKDPYFPRIYPPFHSIYNQAERGEREGAVMGLTALSRKQNPPGILNQVKQKKKDKEQKKIAVFLLLLGKV